MIKLVHDAGVVHVDLYTQSIMYLAETNGRLRQVHLELVDCDDVLKHIVSVFQIWVEQFVSASFRLITLL
jgi:hypothetical protein